MRKSILPMIIALTLIAAALPAGTVDHQARELRLPVKTYVDKMKAAWIGQMAGVGWGGPTEFHWKGEIIPEDKIPQWKPEMINQFGQDDIYVEMTFLRTLELYGFDVSIRQAGVDFANSGYALWHANRAGRDNLRNGIAPPDSGHPRFNSHADDIDYQIEADFSGIICPGMPNTVIELGEKFGRLMNYGDGLYGGQFVGAMYAAAYFVDDPKAIIEAALQCVPRESQFAECIRDVLDCHQAHPDDWQRSWAMIESKYQDNPNYRKASCDKGDFNIDAKINAAYIVMGLLYGDGDPDKTIIISTRCGQDSDCNPSNSAGVLFTTLGYDNLPDKFKSALNPEGKFSHTPYNFPTLVKVCEKLARDAVVRGGGRIEQTPDGEVLIIKGQEPKPSALEQCWEPGPIANSRFTEAEMKQITAVAGMDLSKAIGEFAPGWKVLKCGPDMAPGLYKEQLGRQNVLLTHPLDGQTACILTRTLTLPAGKPKLSMIVGHHPQGDWDLIVKANGKRLVRFTIGPDSCTNGWTLVEVDLSDYAGKETKLELLNQPTDWRFEGAYWAKIEIMFN